MIRNGWKAAAILMTLLLAGCATAKAPGAPTGEVETSVTSQAITTTQATTTTATTAAPVEIKRSPTTGVPVSEETEYRPVACVISNANGATPQWDIKRADILYEFLQEGRSVTRFLGIFNDDVPDNVGPVRSLRFPFLDILGMWEAPLAFCGGSGIEPMVAEKRIETENLPSFANEIKGNYGKYFLRDTSRKAPHNLRANLQLLRDDAPQWDYPVGQLNFSDTAPVGGEPVSKVKVNFTARYEVATYTYDQEQKLWMRFLPSGKPMEDADGTQLSATNLAVLKVHYETVAEAGDVLALTSTGKGEASFFIAGTRIDGTWERESLTDPLVLKDATGEVIRFMPGQSWFCLVNDDAPLETEA